METATTRETAFGIAARQVLAVQPQDAWTISPVTNGAAEARNRQRLHSADRSARANPFGVRAAR
jgi:hypothetical protein